MASVTEEQILEALRDVAVPGRGGDVVSLGLLSGLVVKDRMVHLSIDTTADAAAQMEPVRAACEQAAAAVAGVLSATAVLTEAVAAERPAAPAEPEPGGALPEGPESGFMPDIKV